MQQQQLKLLENDRSLWIDFDNVFANTCGSCLGAFTLVLIPGPPPLRLPNPVFTILPAGTYLFRLFNPANFGTGPLTLRAFGPLRRFDHHEGIRRGLGRQAGLSSTGREILYAAPSLSCCVAEIFGDTGFVLFADWHVVTPILTRPLRLLDLRGSGAMRAGSVAALVQAPDHRLGQSWSRYFYEHKDYSMPDGLLYAGAHNSEDALALYERSADALTCSPGDVMRLDDPALHPVLLDIGRQNNLVISSLP